MKLIKKFESYKTREEMCDYLCNVCGCNMVELEEKSDEELQEMCDMMSNSMSKKYENQSMREEMCDYLCNVCGCNMYDLEEKSDEELQEMCNMMEPRMTSEAKKSEKWIQDAIKKPGSLRKQMGKKEGEKLSKSEINAELKELKSKDKDKSKEGVQGLSKKDLTKFRRLNLAKTLKGLKEHQEHEHYMFFANLENMIRMCEEILSMDKNEIDQILHDGHGWAVDHIATSKDDVEEVFNFLHSHTRKSDHFNSMNQSVHNEPSHEETEGHLANKDLEQEMKSGIKSFATFKK